MPRQFDSTRGKLSRGVAVVARGEQRERVLALFDAGGAAWLGQFTQTARYDGRPYQAGQFAPADLRSSVVASALITRRLEPVQPPPGLEVVEVSAETPPAEHPEVGEFRQPPAEAAREERSAESGEPAAEVEVQGQQAGVTTTVSTADGTAQVDTDAAEDYAAGADVPAWYPTPLADVLSQRIVRKLKKADLTTAGELDRYANANAGDLAALELDEKQLKKVHEAMAKLSNPAAAG